LRGHCGAAESLRFGPLPESGAEIDALVDIWRRQMPGEPLHVQKGLDAGEGALRRLAPGSRIVHVASHGFAAGGACAGGESELIDPLLLSGLALAGANRRAQAEADDDDGIVTARELAGLDLRGVEWVVLSACDTGLGRPRAGEGVLGLRRAIAMAGVRSQVMTLWPVDDRAARSFMAALYEERLAKGRGTAEAVRAASLALLTDLRRQGRSPHPALWAAFVAVGDWR
jgi:CHAT domain-containing protein